MIKDFLYHVEVLYLGCPTYSTLVPWYADTAKFLPWLSDYRYFFLYGSVFIHFAFLLICNVILK